MNLESVRADEVLRLDCGAMERQDRGDAFDTEFLKRTAGAAQNLISLNFMQASFGRRT